MNTSVMIKIKHFFRTDSFSHEVNLNKDRIYVVPEYQRKIRWKAENAKILIEDLLINAKFLGTVFISSKGSNNVYYELIDGQQRVTVLFMIYWAYARKKKSDRYKTCEYLNQSYKYLKKACEVDFDIHTLTDKYGISDTEFYQMDVLDQTDIFKELWDTICNILNTLSPLKEETLFNNLINSEINLIHNFQEEYEVDDKTCVNYFLDINDRTVSLDDVDIFKGYLFKNDFENMTTRWARLYRKIKILRQKRLNYPVLSILEHYILCNANKKLEYKINKIQHFKITKDIRIHDDEYKEGRHILDLIHEPDYSKKMMDDLDEFLGFLENILDDMRGTAECFSKYFTVVKGKELDSFTKLNCIQLIRRIILNDDGVPKLLVMKFFFERLQNDHCKKEDYKDIYYVYLCCTMFSLIDKTKASASFTRIAMSKKWEEALYNKAVEYLKKTVWSGNYSRKIEKKDLKLEDGAKYFPLDVACIYKHFKLKNEKIEKINENAIYHFLNNNALTSEHLFINQSYSYNVKYRGGSFTASCPTRIKRYVAYIGNYLYIDEEANRKIGNAPIWEKVEHYNKYIEEHESLGCEFSDKQFELIKKSFNNFPNMNEISTQEGAEKEFDRYYSNFEKMYKTYMDMIKEEKDQTRL